MRFASHLCKLAMTFVVARGAVATQVGYGIRTEYVDVAGTQFGGLSNGVGATGFVSLPVIQRLDIEIGLSVTRHHDFVICFSEPCPGDHSKWVAGAYVQPTIQESIGVTPLTAYGGVRGGLLVAPFTYGNLGVDIGGSVGLLIRITGSLYVDVGALGTVVYAGSLAKVPSFARGSELSRRSAVRLGLAIVR